MTDIDKLRLERDHLIGEIRKMQEAQQRSNLDVVDEGAYPHPNEATQDWEAEVVRLRREVGYWRDIAQASLGLLGHR